MVKVVKHNAESIDRLLRRFKRSCNNAGVVSTYKAQRFFEKDSETRKVTKQRLARVYAKAAAEKANLSSKRQYRNVSELVARKETKSPSLRRPG